MDSPQERDYVLVVTTLHIAEEMLVWICYWFCTKGVYVKFHLLYNPYTMSYQRYIGEPLICQPIALGMQFSVMIIVHVIWLQVPYFGFRPTALLERNTVPLVRNEQFSHFSFKCL